MDVEALLGPLVEADGLELYDVIGGREHGRKVLRVVVDGPDGVDVNALSRLSERISRRLDAAGYESGPYELQVTSPGLERALRRPEHFMRSVGEQVTLRTVAPLRGTRRHTGTLVAADDDGCTIDGGDAELRVAYADITSARTVVDWGAELKRSNA